MMARSCAWASIALALGGCKSREGADTFVVSFPALAGIEQATDLPKDNAADDRSSAAIARDTALLAREALRRGLGSSYDVQRALRIAIAEIEIKERFLPEVDPAKVPEEILKRAYKNNYFRFNPPEAASVSHILFEAPEKAPESEAAQAEKLCQAALADARRVKSADEFRALKKQYSDRGVKVRLEEFRTWRGQMLAPFEQAAMKMRTPGEIGGCVRTSYGFHVIYLHEHEPAKARPFDAAKEEVREKAHGEWRALKFTEWLKTLRATHAARISKQASEIIQSATEKERGGPR